MKRTRSIVLIGLPTFFEGGALDHIDGPDPDAYIVDDVDYCIEQANDMVAGEGDFAAYGPQPNQFVDVTELDRSVYPSFVNKAIEADYQHCAYTERLVFDNRDKGGFARWGYRVCRPKPQGRTNAFIYHVWPSLPAVFRAW